jgi:hypothetical protein
MLLEVVSKPQTRFKGKASRALEAESARARWRMSSTFQFAGQRSHWASDGVLKPLLHVSNRRINLAQDLFISKVL